MTPEEFKTLLHSERPAERKQAIVYIRPLLTSLDEHVRRRGYELFNEGLKEALYRSCLNYGSLAGGFTEPLMAVIRQTIEYWATGGRGDSNQLEGGVENASRESFPASDAPAWTELQIGAPDHDLIGRRGGATALPGSDGGTENSMDAAIPASLKAEHDELHRELAAATKAPGPVGEAARAVAKLLHPHFIDEEAFALPPLGLLAKLARGKAIRDASPIIAMTDRLRAELPRMLAEHRAITAALRRLEDEARAADDERSAQLAAKIIAHAAAEEEVMYPAAILLGEYLKQKL